MSYKYIAINFLYRFHNKAQFRTKFLLIDIAREVYLLGILWRTYLTWNFLEGIKALDIRKDPQKSVDLFKLQPKSPISSSKSLGCITNIYKNLDSLSTCLSYFWRKKEKALIKTFLIRTFSQQQKRSNSEF